MTYLFVCTPRLAFVFQATVHYSQNKQTNHSITHEETGG